MITMRWNVRHKTRKSHVFSTHYKPDTDLDLQWTALKRFCWRIYFFRWRGIPDIEDILVKLLAELNGYRIVYRA